MPRRALAVWPLLLALGCSETTASSGGEASAGTAGKAGASGKAGAGQERGQQRQPGGLVCPGARWLDGQDTFFGDEKNPKTASAAENDHDWKILEWELTAPPQARRILVWLSAHNPGKVTFDHVAVYRK